METAETPGPASTNTKKNSVTRKGAWGAIVLGFVMTAAASTSALGLLIIIVGFFLVLPISAILPRLIVALLAGGIVAVPGQRMREGRAASMQAAENAESEARRIASLHSDIKAAFDRNDWERADALISDLRVKRPNDAEIVIYEREAGPKLREARAAKVEMNRRTAVTRGIASAELIASDKEKCDTPKQIVDAWQLIRQTKPSDPEWARARQLSAALEACRQKSGVTASKGLRQIMISQREQWAQRSEVAMLDQGMDVQIMLGGAAKDTVRLKWALMGRPVVHKMTNGGSMSDGSFLANLEKIGFRRVTFSDGFDYEVYYTLNPQNESNGGGTVLAEMGLGEPLVLR
jgi:hypothetical protein